MENKPSMEELYHEMFAAGLTKKEIRDHITDIMYYRYLDSIELSEALLRHSMVEPDFQEFEVNLDEDYQMIQQDIQQDQKAEVEQTKEVRELQREMAEMRDKMNDLLIDKYTQPVEVKSNEKKPQNKRNNRKKQQNTDKGKED